MAIMVVWGAIGKRLSPSLSIETSSRPRRCTARLFDDLACDPCQRIETMGLALTRMAVLQDHLQDTIPFPGNPYTVGDVSPNHPSVEVAHRVHGFRFHEKM